jgi:hypothetical protein
MLFALCALGLCSVAVAGNWPQLENRLATWEGAKEVQLPAGVNPLEDPIFAPVVELLLREGFAVQAKGENVAPYGLILKQHQADAGVRLVLTRACDGALLALEPLSASSAAQSAAKNGAQHSESTRGTKVLSTTALAPSRPSVSPSEPLRIESDAQGYTLRTASDAAHLRPDMLVDMPGTPRSIATWAAPQASVADFHVFALYDTRLVHFCYHSGRLEQIAEFAPPVQVSRALRLECSDLDADGTPELAPVWVEDIYSVDEGTESRLHSWVVEVGPDGDMEAGSADLEGYLALVGEQLYLQKRGAHRAFTPAVYAVEFADGAYRRSRAPVSETQHWVFNHARWPDSERVLIWNDDQRLVLAARSSTGRRSTAATGTLLSDFGTYVGASIYVPLEEPEYRSGFSAHDKVMARKVPVPRRMHPYGDTLFTLARGREVGMPLVGKPSGKDKLVQINAGGNRLKARFPFSPVDAFILDFDLLEQVDGAPGAILLLNEKQDGTGQAYLQVQ